MIPVTSPVVRDCGAAGITSSAHSSAEVRSANLLVDIFNFLSKEKLQPRVNSNRPALMWSSSVSFLFSGHPDQSRLPHSRDPRTASLSAYDRRWDATSGDRRWGLEPGRRAVVRNPLHRRSEELV